MIDRFLFDRLLAVRFLLCFVAGFCIVTAFGSGNSGNDESPQPEEQLAADVSQLPGAQTGQGSNVVGGGRTSGGIAFESILSDGTQKTGVAVGISGQNTDPSPKIQSLQGRIIAPVPSSRYFQALPGWEYDAEVKLLEFAAHVFGGDSETEGSVTLTVNQLPCDSCKGVIDQFKALFPKIDFRLLTTQK